MKYICFNGTRVINHNHSGGKKRYLNLIHKLEAHNAYLRRKLQECQYNFECLEKSKKFISARQISKFRISRLMFMKDKVEHC